MHVTTHRRHPGSKPMSSIQAPASHANAPHRVHMGDRQRHVQAALGRNTSSEARQQRPGQIANEKWITARQSAPMRERQLVYLQYTPPCSRRRKTTVSSNFLRQTVTRSFYMPLCTTHHTALHPRVSFSTIRAVYAMMALRRHMPTEHQAGRRCSGLCRSGGSGNCLAAPTGPPDLRHAQAPVSAR